jgi:molybdopterin-containing oxidoreductase family iron-sulfur binding subunit
MMACPYKARSFVHEDLTEQLPRAPRGKGTVESCTFCVHRVDKDREPACVEACTQAEYGALVFGDMNDPNSELSKKFKSMTTRQVRADLRLNTGVRYHGV